LLLNIHVIQVCGIQSCLGIFVNFAGIFGLVSYSEGEPCRIGWYIISAEFAY
jgi:hypothetical protein